MVGWRREVGSTEAISNLLLFVLLQKAGSPPPQPLSTDARTRVPEFLCLGCLSFNTDHFGHLHRVIWVHGFIFDLRTRMALLQKGIHQCHIDIVFMWFQTEVLRSLFCQLSSPEKSNRRKRRQTPFCSRKHFLYLKPNIQMVTSTQTVSRIDTVKNCDAGSCVGSTHFQGTVHFGTGSSLEHCPTNKCVRDSFITSLASWAKLAPLTIFTDNKAATDDMINVGSRRSRCAPRVVFRTERFNTLTI